MSAEIFLLLQSIFVCCFVQAAEYIQVNNWTNYYISFRVVTAKDCTGHDMQFLFPWKTEQSDSGDKVNALASCLPYFHIDLDRGWPGNNAIIKNGVVQPGTGWMKDALQNEPDYGQRYDHNPSDSLQWDVSKALLDGIGSLPLLANGTPAANTINNGRYFFFMPTGANGTPKLYILERPEYVSTIKEVIQNGVSTITNPKVLKMRSAKIAGVDVPLGVKIDLGIWGIFPAYPVPLHKWAREDVMLDEKGNQYYTFLPLN